MQNDVELRFLLMAADELLLRSAELYKLDQPVSKNRESVAHLIWADSKIFERDRQYIQHTDDLITLGGDQPIAPRSQVIADERFKVTRNTAGSIYYSRQRLLVRADASVK